jgi:hypothetical protein
MYDPLKGRGAFFVQEHLRYLKTDRADVRNARVSRIILFILKYLGSD